MFVLESVLLARLGADPGPALGRTGPPRGRPDHDRGEGDPAAVVAASYGPGAIYAHRELVPPVNVPTSLLIALGLTIAPTSSPPRSWHGQAPFVRVNLPIGVAGLLLGALTLVARREAFRN